MIWQSKRNRQILLFWAANFKYILGFFDSLHSERHNFLIIYTWGAYFWFERCAKSCCKWSYSTSQMKPNTKWHEMKSFHFIEIDHSFLFTENSFHFIFHSFHFIFHSFHFSFISFHFSFISFFILFIFHFHFISLYYEILSVRFHLRSTVCDLLPWLDCWSAESQTSYIDQYSKIK